MKKTFSIILLGFLGMNLYANSIFYNFDNDPKVKEQIREMFGDDTFNKTEKSGKIDIKEYKTVTNNEESSLFTSYNSTEMKKETNNIKLSMGVSVDNNQISGYMRSATTVNYFNKTSAETDNNANTGNLGLDDDIGFSAWADIKLKNSILPNIKLTYSYIHNKGKSSYITSNTKLFKDVLIKKAYGNASTELTVNTIDLNAYYTFNNVLGFLNNLNIGIGVDYSNISFKLVDNYANQTMIDKDQNILMPYLSLSGLTKNFFSYFNMYGSLKVSSAGTDKLIKTNIALRFNKKIKDYKVFGSIGYKYNEKTYETGEYKTVLRYQGPYAELGLNF